MITVRSLVPLAIAALVAGLLTFYLLANDVAAGPWLLALLLVAHGALHIAFAVPPPMAAAATPEAPTASPFDLGRSWLVARQGMDATVVRRIGRGLVVAIVVGFMLAALATLGFIVPADWWTALVVGAASLSFLLLVIAFAATVLIGFGIDVALIGFALSSVWTPA